MSEPSVGATEAAPGIWRIEQPLLPGIPLNLHLLKGERVVLVDTGLASSYPWLEALLESAAVRWSDVRLIVNTHAHHDHIGSNRRAKEATGALLAAPAAAVPWIEDHVRHVREFVLHHPEIIPDTPGLRAEVEPTLDGEVRVDLIVGEGFRVGLGGGLELEAFSFPGHMFDELGFYERTSGTLLLADAVTGIDWPLFHGWVLPTGYRRTLAKLRALTWERPVRRVLMAHYPLMEIDEFRGLLERAEAFVTQVDETVAHVVREAGDGIDLGTVWRATCAALNKQLEFRGLAMVDAHLRELLERGDVVRVGPDRYAWAGR